MKGNNMIIGQSGGPTAAINATLRGVIEGALKSEKVDKVYGAINGMEGVLKENFTLLSDTFEQEENRRLLSQTPSAYLGSCRFKLPDSPEDGVYVKIFDIFKKYGIAYFIYIGGNDSMDTVYKLSEYAKAHGHDINIVGVPKTIDNDLAVTDHCPGYGSAAKYIAATVREIARDSAVYDLKSVTIIEIMGRNAGWLTAAAVMARSGADNAPHLIYLPERAFCVERFLTDIKNVPAGNVVVAVSEGIRDKDGAYICESAASGVRDAFGHKMLSGTGKVLEGIVRDRLSCKVRSIEINTPQRCAAHFASETDLNEAVMIGRGGAEAAAGGKTGVMMYFAREGEYNISIGTKCISEIANVEKSVPGEYISENGNDITGEFVNYASPLILGEPALIIKDGLPVHIAL
jgi:6-phosphofructokinase